MGWGGLYNHALDCNVNWVALADHKAIEFYSKSRVSAGEELFIRYRHPHNPERDFEEEISIIKNAIQRTKWACLIHGEDITRQIEACGGTVFERMIIPAVNVKRYIHFVRSKDV